MEHLPMEDPFPLIPDVTLDEGAQRVIESALMVARHNQEFRDGIRRKPFSSAFVLAKIDAAAGILSAACAAAIAANS